MSNRELTVESGCIRIRGVTRMARLFGVSQSHLSRVIRGERKPGDRLDREMRRLGIIPMAKEAV